MGITQVPRVRAHHRGMQPTSRLHGPRGRGPRVLASSRAAWLLTAAVAVTLLGLATTTDVAAEAAVAAAVESEVRYHARDQLSSWIGRAPLRFERLELDLDDLAATRLEAVVAVAELRSGNALRDFQARTSVFDAATHPELRFTLQRLEGTLDRARTGPQELLVVGDLSVAGSVRELRAPATVRLEADALQASVRFEVSLAAYGLPAPRFLTLVVDDVVTVEVDVTWPLDPDSTTTTR